MFTLLLSYPTMSIQWRTWRKVIVSAHCPVVTTTLHRVYDRQWECAYSGYPVGGYTPQDTSLLPAASMAYWLLSVPDVCSLCVSYHNTPFPFKNFNGKDAWVGTLPGHTLKEKHALCSVVQCFTTGLKTCFIAEAGVLQAITGRVNLRTCTGVGFANCGGLSKAPRTL